MTYVRPEIAAMSGYVPGEQLAPGKFIKLNTNENPYPPSPAVVRAIQEAAERSLARYPDPVANAFRICAADLLGVQPDWILCGNGSDDILTIVTRAFVGQGEMLRLPYPSYVLYKTLAEIQGARYEEVHFARDWSLPEAFAKAAGDLKLVFLAQSEQSFRNRVAARPDSGIGRAAPLPSAGRRSVRRFRRNELHRTWSGRTTRSWCREP